MKNKRDIKARVKAQYAEVASKDEARSSSQERARDSIKHAEAIGYSEREMKSVPEAAAVAHGCGNPTALAELKAGETVLDLGCGGGLDAFLAARRVGRKGKVIGLDMTPEMIEKARANARAGNFTNVEFKVAEIERLPVPDDSVDAVISNCVINHSADKSAVFREAYRVLKPGGRMFVSDLVTVGRLPEDIRRNAGKLWTEWLAVASDRREYLRAIQAAGFRPISVIAEGPFPLSESDAALKGRIISIQVKGGKRYRKIPSKSMPALTDRDIQSAKSATFQGPPQPSRSFSEAQSRVIPASPNLQGEIFLTGIVQCVTSRLEGRGQGELKYVVSPELQGDQEKLEALSKKTAPCPR